MLFTREGLRAFRRDPLFFITPILSLVALFSTSAALKADFSSTAVVATTAAVNTLWAAVMQHLVPRVSGAPMPWFWLAVGGAALAACAAAAFAGFSIFQSEPLPAFETIIQSTVLLVAVLGLPLGSCLWLARHHRYRRELALKSSRAS
jgi:hypothetical protein